VLPVGISSAVAVFQSQMNGEDLFAAGVTVYLDTREQGLRISSAVALFLRH